MEKLDQFHDGFLNGVLTQGDSAQIYLSTHDGHGFVLEASGIVALRIDEFRESNIIFDVLIRKGDDITIHDVMDVMGFIDEGKAIGKLEEVRRDLLILEINPSYGASCIILAKSVELQPRLQ